MNSRFEKYLKIFDQNEVSQADTQKIAYSGAIRTPIPALPGQSFRDKPDTDSAINQPF